MLGLVLIIVSIFNLSCVKLMLGWVVTSMQSMCTLQVVASANHCILDVLEMNKVKTNGQVLVDLASPKFESL